MKNVDDVAGQAQVDALAEKFGICSASLVAGSYADLLTSESTPRRRD
jgi:hypothetical protein